MSLVRTRDILLALQAKLEGLTFTAENLPHLPDLAGEPVFQEVGIYSRPNLTAALADLLAFEDRFCAVVPIGDEHEFLSKAEGVRAINTVRRHSAFTLLISDRDFGSRQEAFAGDEEDSPGVIGLKDIVVDALTGQDLGHSELKFLPEEGAPFFVADTIREGQALDDLSGRDAWQQTFLTPAGTYRPGPQERGGLYVR